MTPAPIDASTQTTHTIFIFFFQLHDKIIFVEDGWVQDEEKYIMGLVFVVDEECRPCLDCGIFLLLNVLDCFGYRMAVPTAILTLDSRYWLFIMIFSIIKPHHHHRRRRHNHRQCVERKGRFINKDEHGFGVIKLVPLCPHRQPSAKGDVLLANEHNNMCIFIPAIL